MEVTATQVAKGPNMPKWQDCFYADRTPECDIDTPISVVNGPKWVKEGCEKGWRCAHTHHRSCLGLLLKWLIWEHMPTEGLGAAHLDFGA